MYENVILLAVLAGVCSGFTFDIPRCDMIVCESMPENLTYENTAMKTIEIWKVWADLINKSSKSIRISSFYWTLLNRDVNKTKFYPSSRRGEEIFNLLKQRSKEVPLEIVQNQANESEDLLLLQDNKLVKVNFIDFKRLIKRGVQHSKVWIGDETRAFVGSANMDWRSLTQIKELGVYITNCPDIVGDVYKFWQGLHMLSGPNATIPKQWPPYLSPLYNHSRPFVATVGGILSSIYVATSPPAFNPPGRTDDFTAISNTISRANKYICISVMDMFPLTLGYGDNQDTFWPLIENQLKKSAIDRQVSVKLLISLWRHSQTRMIEYLRSLEDLSTIHGIDIDVKLFIVPAFNADERDIPFSRVSHSKYMVTDNTAYIGTSNWSGDYFDYTGGASVVVEEHEPDERNLVSLRTQLKRVFDTDWYSIYAHELL